VSAAGEPAHDFWHERHAALAFDDLFGYTDLHGRGT
jgi:hypothetical protein